MTQQSGARERAAMAWYSRLNPHRNCRERDLAKYADAATRGNTLGEFIVRQINEAFAVADFALALTASPCVEAAGGEEKIRLLCKMMVSAGGLIDASDESHNLLSYFCDDVKPIDTFNQAANRKLIHVTHDNRFDNSTATITDAGREFAAFSAAPTPPAETGGTEP